VRHEPLFPISTLPRAPARTGKHRPILPAATGPRRNRSLLPLTNDGPSPSSATHPTDRERRSPALPQPPAASAHSNHISVRRRSGFLHVAVSKAPTPQPSVRDQFVMWALQIQLKDISALICDGQGNSVGSAFSDSSPERANYETHANHWAACLPRRERHDRTNSGLRNQASMRPHSTPGRNWRGSSDALRSIIIIGA
jgi:hypothetical protein